MDQEDKKSGIISASYAPQQGDPGGGVPVLDLASKEAVEGVRPGTLENVGYDHISFQSPDVDIEQTSTPQEPSGSRVVANEDYSVFTTNQKRSIIVAGSFAAWFSPMTGSIYYPALNQVSKTARLQQGRRLTCHLEDR